MKFKETLAIRLGTEYKVDLTDRLKIVIEDLDQSYFPKYNKGEVVITDISRSTSEQRSYYKDQYDKTGKIPFTYHYKNEDGLTCAVDIRLTGFSKEEVDVLIGYLVGKWREVFGLHCLAHDIEGYHLHMQVVPSDKKTDDRMVCNYLISKSKPITDYFISTPKKIEVKEPQLTNPPLEFIKKEVAITVEKRFSFADPATKTIMIQALTEIFLILSGKIGKVKWIPSAFRKYVINFIVKRIINSFIKGKV